MFADEPTSLGPRLKSLLLGRRGRSVLLFFLIYLVGAPIVLQLAFRHPESFRIEIGASDDAFVLGNRAWGRHYRDSGPFRLRRGVRWMTYFAARMAFQNASVRIPAVVDAGDGELRLRLHRYGQPGLVHVLANGIRLDTLVFEHDSYPWDVRRLKVPSQLFRTGDLTLTFRGDNTVAEKSLDGNAVAAFDWIELAPARPESYLRPVTSTRVLAFLLPLLVVLTLLWAGARSWLCFATGASTLLVVVLAYASAPGPTTGALVFVWVVFPLGGLIWALLRFPLRIDRRRSRQLAAVFTLVLLAHSTIIFFPNHMPPDLGPHLGQIRQLDNERWSYEQFWVFSSSHPESGKGKPHFGADYRAPYPPWTYFAVHGLRRIADAPRFLLEFLGMFFGAAMMLLVYGLSRRLSAIADSAAWSLALMAVEISTWHHAARVHIPGHFGAFCFLVTASYLVYRKDRFERWGTVFLFSLLCAAATLSYTATLFHLVFFVAWLAFLTGVENRSLATDSRTRRIVAGAAAGTLVSVAVFYRRFIVSALAAKEAILSGESYRAPARVWFLRNQMRDTVRILRFGYPLWIVLALPAYLKLRVWTRGSFARRVILAWTATYLFLLVLKDPVFFPQLFLHVKEDLLIAPLLCILGGMTLQRLATLGRKGKWAALAILLVLAACQVRDYLYNVDPIAVWAEVEQSNP